MSPNRFMRIDDDQDESDDIPSPLKGRIPTVQQTYDVPSTPPAGPPRRTAELQTVTEYVEVIPENALIVQDGTTTYKRFTMTPTALHIPEDATEIEWEEVGRWLLGVQGSVNWWLYDWLAFGDQHQWGETYQRVAADYQYEVETLWSYASVARSIQPLIRNQGLSFSHHRLIATYEPNEQKHWLDEAAKNRWKLWQLRAALRTAHPPTLSREKDPVGNFMRSLTSFTRKAKGIIEAAEPGQRRQMAILLREWAAEIDKDP